MTDEEIIRNHYIFSTTHELDDDNEFLKKYILNLEHENKQLKEQRSKAIEYIKKCTSSQDVIAHFLGYTEVKELMKILESNKED